MNFQPRSNFKQYKPKKRDTSRRSTPTGLGDLLGRTLKRHGIHNQVNSAMIVHKAQELIERGVAPHIAADVRVVSYHSKQLFIACRYGEAAEALKPFLNTLHDQLIAAFPDLQLTNIESRFRPQAFKERGY